jgi:molybdopterin synthase catalytic subunit
MSNGFFDLPAHAQLPQALDGTGTRAGRLWTGMREILTQWRRSQNSGKRPGGKIATMASPRVLIGTEDFNISDEVAVLRAGDKRIGAVCTFTGTVRDRNDGLSVSSMELEHYPGMTEKAIEAMIDEALSRFDIFGARVVHRIGLLQPLDQVVLVAVTSAHRGESFRACEFLMDYLKTQAPFWKKEQTPEGARWVDARVTDDAALAKWGIRASNVPAA